MGTFFILITYMIAFISPAKTLDFEKEISIGDSTKPYFLDEAEKVNNKLRKQSRKKLKELQSISSQLAALNYDRNQQWNVAHEEKVKQAILAFKGDVYIGLEAETWSAANMKFANDHLRILSGLYGILRPTDMIQPYRLEMGTSLPVGRRKDLYHFWGDKIKAYFKENISPDETVINLASVEYFKAVEKAGIKNPVLSVEFKDFSNGEFKVVSFFAKKARGMMANYIVKNEMADVDDLKGFNTSGYYFDAKESTDTNYVFLRDQQQ